MKKGGGGGIGEKRNKRAIHRGEMCNKSSDKGNVKDNAYCKYSTVFC